MVGAVSEDSLATSSEVRTPCVTSETRGFRGKLSFFFCFSTDCNRERGLNCEFSLMRTVWFESGPGSLNQKSPEIQGFFSLTAPIRTIQTTNSKNPAPSQPFSPPPRSVSSSCSSPIHETALSQPRKHPSSSSPFSRVFRSLTLSFSL